MADVNAFIDAVGKDVSATVAPRIEELGKGIATFTTSLIQEVFQRYQPELAGELRTRIVKDGVEIIGQDVRLDLKRRDTGTLVASLDVPVSLKIRVDGVSLMVSETTIGLDVVR